MSSLTWNGLFEFIKRSAKFVSVELGIVIVLAYILGQNEVISSNAVASISTILIFLMIIDTLIRFLIKRICESALAVAETKHKIATHNYLRPQDQSLLDASVEGVQQVSKTIVNQIISDKDKTESIR